MGKKQPQTFLKAVGRTPTLEDVAELIKEGKVKNVVIMVSFPGARGGGGS